MSKTTLRKRIALTATTALFAGMVSVVSAPVASAHLAAGTTGANTQVTVGNANANLFVATLPNTATAAVVGGNTGDATTIDDAARSKGLLYKDSSSGIAQSATVLAGGVLSLYARVSTASAFSVTGGSLSSVFGGTAGNVAEYNANNRYSFVGIAAPATATGVAALWSVGTTSWSLTHLVYRLQLF
jgi:hypothetical protein